MKYARENAIITEKVKNTMLKAWTELVEILLKACVDTHPTLYHDMRRSPREKDSRRRGEEENGCGDVRHAERIARTSWGRQARTLG